MSVAAAGNVYLVSGGVGCAEARYPTVHETAANANYRLFAYAASRTGSGLIVGPDGLTNTGGWSAARQPAVEYHFRVPSPGVWYVWIRGHAGGQHDSTYAGQSGGGPVNAAYAGQVLTVGDWQGTTIDARNSLTVPAGGDLLRVRLHPREYFSRIDAVLIASNSTYDPNAVNGGLGPAASAVEGVTPDLPLTRTVLSAAVPTTLRTTL